MHRIPPYPERVPDLRDISLTQPADAFSMSQDVVPGKRADFHRERP